MHRMRKVYILPFIMAALLYVSGLTAYALAPADYVKLESRPSPELIGRASSYIDADTLLDKAVTALSVVANRYYANPTDREARKNAIIAMSHLGNIYSFRIFDFPKAYTNLSTARMIAEEDGDDYNLSQILMRLANIYTVCGDSEETKADNVKNLLTEAMDRALESQNEDIIARLCINMSIMQLQENGWGAYAGAVNKVVGHRFPASSPYGQLCVDVLSGMRAYYKGDYALAESALKKALGIAPPDESFRERYLYGIMYLLQYVYDRKGDFVAEEGILRDRLKLTRDLGLVDYELYTYMHLMNFFTRVEKPDSADKYRFKYLMLKEEMEQNSGLSKVGNLEMLRQVEKTNDEIRELSIQRQKERRNLTIAIAVIAVVVILMVVLVYMFFNLRRNHRILFEKNRELLDLETHYRMVINHHEEASAAPSAPDTPEPKEDEPAGRESEPPEEYLRVLFSRILKLMDASSEIYAQGFGIDSLASMLGESQRNVSKAINACAGTNFHQFLNSYRIREACRIMQTTDFEVHTVEYVAEKVGFKSRTSFASLFKKTTGLTPSEYWRMSRKGQ